jgi:pyruvate/2-oxoacid:ferredoxin oxidoreductase alpha subunit/ferredoxin
LLLVLQKHRPPTRSSTMAMPRRKPELSPEYCKGCDRCLDSCAYDCFTLGREVHPVSGFVPVALDISRCTGCGLCFEACPEPYALRPVPLDDATPAEHAGSRTTLAALDIPDSDLTLPESGPLLLKGLHASAIGAILAGSRYFFGYPITPSTEGTELMARLLPRLGGEFVQAVSEVAAINMMYGAGAAGVRATTFTSSPGLSLMLEGISYMIGAEVPGVIVHAMRGGPGLGNIAPEQADIKLACRGLGHGNTHAIVLAPATPQEMLDLTRLAFDLSFTYRNPVLVLADGHVGQTSGRVGLPRTCRRPAIPSWAVSGDSAHRRNLISSIFLDEIDLEAHNRRLIEKYDRISAAEQRAVHVQTGDADVLLIACNSPARTCEAAVAALRSQGTRAGLFRPLTLWPFPIDSLAGLLSRVRRIVVVEASPGQLEDEIRLAISRAAIAHVPAIAHVQRYGGALPSKDEIVARVADEAAHGAAA